MALSADRADADEDGAARAARLAPGAGGAGVVASRSRSLAILLGTAVAVFIADHITKLLVTHNIALDTQVPASGPITIHHVRNSGAAFSLFPQAQWLFLLVAAIVSLYIVLAGHRFGSGRGTQIILGLVLGGAVANAVDRAVQGYVVDFVDLHHWPVFNIADSCIVIGILLAVLTFGRAPQQRRSSA